MAILAAVLCFGGVRAPAQETAELPPLEHRMYVLHTGDTVRIDYARPAEPERPPLIVILEDRYGVQSYTRQLLRVFAAHNYYAVTFPLKSHLEPEAYFNEPSLDSSDIERIVEITVDLQNEIGSNGKVGLFGAGIGGSIGLLAAERLPVFSGAFISYPHDKDLLLNTLDEIDIPVEVNIGKEDKRFDESEMFTFKMRYGSKTNKMVFRLFDDVSQFYLNPAHDQFDNEAFERTLIKAMAFFLIALQPN